MKIIEALREARNTISINELILLFNEYDIEYSNMCDIDMYIYYFENKKDFKNNDE